MLTIRDIKAGGRPSIIKRKNAKFEKVQDLKFIQMAASVCEEHKTSTKKCTHLPSRSRKQRSVQQISKEQLIEDLDSHSGESNEVVNLKELLLVNLDLIQQQRELLDMREKQIVQLKRDNENLRCRLERMDRRMSLGKPPKSPPSHDVANGARGDHTSLTSVSTSVTSSPCSHARRGGGDGDSVDTAALKRKGSMEPHSLVKKFVTIAQNDYEKEQIKKYRLDSDMASSSTPQQQKTNSPRKRSSLSSHYSRRKGLKNRFKIRHINSTSSPRRIASLLQNNVAMSRGDASRNLRTRHSLGVISTPDGDENMPESQCVMESRSQSPPPANRTPSKSSKKQPTAESKLGRSQHRFVARKTRGRPKKIPKDEDVLKTSDEYYVQHEDHVEEIKPKKRKVQEGEVLVPSFRIKPFTPYYVIDGRENFEDEVYLERHKKPENEEKKRKRWDLQQQREEEQRRKLLASNRYQDMTVSSTTNKKAEKNNNTDFTSLLPDPANIEYIEVCDKLPVSVFGYPLPNVQSEDFSLPWFDLDKREKEECKKLRTRKR